MMAIFAVAALGLTPFYQPTPPTHTGNHAPHVTHHHVDHHRRDYGGGYIGNYYEPDTSDYDAADDDAPTTRPVVMYAPTPAKAPVDEKFTFPSYTEIVVKGTPVGNGCTYKSVMSDDDITACKRAARNELNQAR